MQNLCQLVKIPAWLSCIKWFWEMVSPFLITRVMDALFLGGHSVLSDVISPLPCWCGAGDAQWWCWVGQSAVLVLVLCWSLRSSIGVVQARCKPGSLSFLLFLSQYLMKLFCIHDWYVVDRYWNDWWSFESPLALVDGFVQWEGDCAASSKYPSLGVFRIPFSDESKGCMGSMEY